MLQRCVAVARSLAKCAPSSRRLHVQAGRFNSVVVRPDAGRLPPDEAAELADVVAKSKAEGRNSVWLHCGPADGELIKAAAALGMEFHHAEGRELAMLIWLQPSKSMVPPFATTHVGLGGVCVDPSERILVVKEDGQYRATGWKFPGGLSDLGEDFGTAAAREVSAAGALRQMPRDLTSPLRCRQTTPRATDVGTGCFASIPAGRHVCALPYCFSLRLRLAGARRDRRASRVQEHSGDSAPAQHGVWAQRHLCVVSVSILAPRGIWPSCAAVCCCVVVARCSWMADGVPTRAHGQLRRACGCRLHPTSLDITLDPQEITECR